MLPVGVVLHVRPAVARQTARLAAPRARGALRIGVERRSPHRPPIDGAMARPAACRSPRRAERPLVARVGRPLRGLGKRRGRENGRNDRCGSKTSSSRLTLRRALAAPAADLAAPDSRASPRRPAVAAMIIISQQRRRAGQYSSAAAFHRGPSFCPSSFLAPCRCLLTDPSRLNHLPQTAPHGCRAPAPSASPRRSPSRSCPGSTACSPSAGPCSGSTAAPRSRWPG